jgi:hypothetical protein
LEGIKADRLEDGGTASSCEPGSTRHRCFALRPSRFLRWYVLRDKCGMGADLSQAESITEGTLKQWSKQVGDFVNQDEEIATIETDKVGSRATSGDDCLRRAD